MNLGDFASPYNIVPSTLPMTAQSQSVEIHDLTLEGDGEEMAGLLFTHRQRLEIAKRLSAAGVDRISVLGNSPRPRPDEVRSAQAIIDLDLPIKVGAFVKTPEEIRSAARLGMWGITALVWVNDQALPGGHTSEDVLNTCKELTTLAKECDLHTTLMAMDASQTRPAFLKQVIDSTEPQCDEYVIADSLGRLSPFGTVNLMSTVRKWTKRPLQIHPHNHTGVGVANCIGAVFGGASVLQTTVNGLGEFTGIAPLEEVYCAVQMHTSVELSVDFHEIQDLCRYVSSITGMPIPINKPVTGNGAFTIPETEEIQESMLAFFLDGNVSSGLPYAPSLVGRDYIVSIGRKCNAFAVQHSLRRLSIQIDSSQAEIIAKEVIRRLEKESEYVLMSVNELLAIALDLGIIKKIPDDV